MEAGVNCETFKFLNIKIRQVKLLLHSYVTTPHVINYHVHNVIPCQFYNCINGNMHYHLTLPLPSHKNFL